MTSKKLHPLTGEEIRPAGYVNGRPVWPIMGGSEPTLAPVITVPAPPPPPSAEPPQLAAANGRGFSQEDLQRAAQEAAEAARRELLPQVQQLSGTVSELQTEREARVAAEQAREQEAAAAAEAERKSQLTWQQKMEERMAQTNAAIQEERERRERAETLLTRERELHELDAFRQQQLTEAGDTIMPDLQVFVQGDSRDQITRSISLAQEKTASIFADVQRVRAEQRQAMPGVSPSSPTVPMEALGGAPSQVSYTNQELKDMSMTEYRQQRENLMAAAKEAHRLQRQQ